MSTNNGTATGNKRRRLDDDSTATGRNAASTKPNQSALGKSDSPIMAFLASQNAELQQYIISSSKEMVDLVTTIRQRIDTNHRFERPWVNPKTNTPHVHQGTDQPRPFIPNSLRKACPIKASDAMKDNPDIQAALKEAEDIYEKQLDVLATHARKISKLEITTRTSKLQKTFFEYIANVAMGLVITKSFDIGGMPVGNALTRKELSLKACHDAMADWQGGIALMLGCADIDKLKEAFSSAHDYNDLATEEKMQQVDSNFIKDIATDIHEWIPKTTVDLWNEDARKENSRKANAELKLIFKPKAIIQATADVEASIEGVKSDEKIIQAAQQAARKEAQRVVQRANKSMRKKSSAGDKTQSPAPSNGADGNDKSNTRRNKSKSKKKPQETKPKKKAKSKAESKPKSKSGGKSRGNRGDAKGGGGKKGAERH